MGATSAALCLLLKWYLKHVPMFLSATCTTSIQITGLQYINTLMGRILSLKLGMTRRCD